MSGRNKALVALGGGIAGGLLGVGLNKVNWNSGGGRASASSGTINSATVREMSGEVGRVAGANTLPVNPLLPISEIRTLPPPTLLLNGIVITPVDINFNNGVDGSQISDYTMGVLRGIAREAGVNTINITSTQRNAQQQAAAMFDNTLRTGAQEQLDIYGPSGDAVINVFTDTWNGNNRNVTIDAMTNAINEIGPENVSRHAANPAVINVMDVSQRTIRNHAQFIQAAEQRGVRILNENNVFHLEIPQP